MGPAGCTKGILSTFSRKGPNYSIAPNGCSFQSSRKQCEALKPGNTTWLCASCTVLKGLETELTASKGALEAATVQIGLSMSMDSG